MTGTQHVGTLKHKFLHYITKKMLFLLFYYQQIIKLNSCFLHLCYLVATSRQQVTTFSTLEGVGFVKKST
jgi:hypothetical protein